MNNNDYKVKLQAILDTSQIKHDLELISKKNTVKFNVDGSKQFTQETLKMRDAQGNLYNVMTKTSASGELLGRKLTTTTKAMKSADVATLGLVKSGGELANIFKKVVEFGLVTDVIQLFSQVIREAVSAVFELDEAVTEFKKVSDLSGDALDDYTEKLGKMGQEVARTRAEMVDAATAFRKSGYSDEESATLARVATMYQNVADEAISAGESADFIISQMKAFNIEAEDAEHIIDAINEVSNNFAVSSTDLATNIGKASAALVVGDNTMEESLGLMTAIVEITRNGAKASRGLISIQSRLNQITDESSSTGKKLTEWYNKHNIAIYDQNGQLRSLYDIAGDVSKIWGSLSKNEQLYYLNTQAGDLRPFKVNCGNTVKLYKLQHNDEIGIDVNVKNYRDIQSEIRNQAPNRRRLNDYPIGEVRCSQQEYGYKCSG